MKRNLLIVVLLLSAMRAEYAHAQNEPGKLFDIAENKFTRQYSVELERGNRMEILLTSMADMAYISNLDSIVKEFTNELSLIKDSLLPASLSRRIDYNMDEPLVKKIRIRKNAPRAGYYAFVNGSPALLKVDQDTIVINGRIPADWLRQTKRYKPDSYREYYFCILFYLNDLNDLFAYKDGRLNEKLRIIQQNYNAVWQYRADQRLQLKKYPEISSSTARGYIYPTEAFVLKKSIDIQNYKDHFIPSVSFIPTIIHTGDFIKREFGLGIEAHFLFEKQDSGSIKTRVNLFAGIEYRVTPLIKTQQRVKLYPSVSLAYLVQRKGTSYDRHTFRLGVGSFEFGNFFTRIQPAIYFHDFFKNVTPSLRLLQRF